MAEAVAAIGLAASIATLVEIGVKLVRRLQELSSKISELPESLQSLSTQLTWLNGALQDVESQVNRRSISQNTADKLKPLIDDLLSNIKLVEAQLDQLAVSKDASKPERVLKALRSLAKKDMISQLSESIHQSITLLILYQTTQTVDWNDRIAEEFSKLKVAPQTPPKSLLSFGLCLRAAPRIDEYAFKGRTAELNQLKDWLTSSERERVQCVVSIVGMGGIGKTQLSLAHARECSKDYSSVFWLNARDETSLRQGIEEYHSMLVPRSSGPTMQDQKDETSKLKETLAWFSESGNNQWLIIYDNYDDPDIPGSRSSSGFDIRSYLPERAQGSILVTTRSTKLDFSKKLYLKSFTEVATSISVLSQRSARNLELDDGASDLAHRLGGLPLALATAGTFLATAADTSCRDYLELYASTWTDLVGDDGDELYEYESRTLASTWIISLCRVRQQMPDAAELLIFLAYLSPRHIWYELIAGPLKAASTLNRPEWMCRITATKLRFQRAMTKLHDYCLVDISGTTFQIHPCLHDWLIASYVTPPDPGLFQSALYCVGSHLCYADITAPNVRNTDKRLLGHVDELLSPRFDGLWQSSQFKVLDITILLGQFAKLQSNFARYEKAEKLLLTAISNTKESYEDINDLFLPYKLQLAGVYSAQNRHAEAETLLSSVFDGYLESPLITSPGVWHLLITTLHNLAGTYFAQNKLAQAESTALKALRLKEKAFGPDSIGTLLTVAELAEIYHRQNKLDKAEEMSHRALDGFEKLGDFEYGETALLLVHLGKLNYRQGKIDEAERLFQRALVKYDDLLGPTHEYAADVVNNLAVLYCHGGESTLTVIEARKKFTQDIRDSQDIDAKCTAFQRLSILYRYHEDFVTVSRMEAIISALRKLKSLPPSLLEKTEVHCVAPTEALLEQLPIAIRIGHREHEDCLFHYFFSESLAVPIFPAEKLSKSEEVLLAIVNACSECDNVVAMLIARLAVNAAMASLWQCFDQSIQQIWDQA